MPFIIHELNRAPFRPGLEDHQQSLEEAIASYTKEAAYTEFKEAEKGMLKEGYLADLVLLSGDIFATKKEDLPEMSVAMTVCDGQIDYEAP